MRIAVITMAHNEKTFLPIWIAHYSFLVGRENLFVVDHGSDDGSTIDIDVNLIRIPREKLDEWQRAIYISRFHASLLCFYDYVIYTDVDEMLVVDPAKAKSLSDWLASKNVDVIAACGVNVLHDRSSEPAIDFGRPLLAQRTWVQFDPLYCKPTISRKVVQWTPGFHTVDKGALITSEIFLFHLKSIDWSTFKQQVAIRQGVVLSDASRLDGLSTHFSHSLGEQEHKHFPPDTAFLNRNETEDFTFQVEFGRMRASENRISSQRLACSSDSL